MDVWEATTLARSFSKQGLTFSLEFYGYDDIKESYTGQKYIRQCQVRPGNSKDRNDDYKLALYDVENELHRSCWIPLIKTINGIKVITP